MKHRTFVDSSERSDNSEPETIRWDSCPEMWAWQTEQSLMDFDEEGAWV